MTGFLPPSSSWTLAPLLVAPAWMARPTALEPVKEMPVMPSASVMAGPITEPEPMTRLSTPLGRPTSSKIWTRRVAVSGVISAGLKTTVLP